MKIFNQRNKKASLQISINAIVILVMAMVVLGLGLGFIRNLIDTGQKQLGRAMTNTELENPASPENPITADKIVSIREGKSGVIHIGWYNTYQDPITANPGAVGPDDTVDCSYEAGGVVPFYINAPGVQVPGGESQGWQATVRPQVWPQDSGKYTCPIIVYEGGTPGKSTSTIVEITK